MASKSVLEELLSEQAWLETLSECEERGFRNREKLKAYLQVIQSGEALTIASEVLRSEYRLSPPTLHTINKGGHSKKKLVYTYPPKEELLLKVINRILQPHVSSLISPACHSFRRGRSAKTAFRALLRDKDIRRKHCLRLDIVDYFNSIDVERLLASLPPILARDACLMQLLEQMLLQTEVVRNGETVVVEQKGVMAGTPLAPLLSNLYLTDLDELFRLQGVTYARYSDDIIIFAGEGEIGEHEALIRSHLARKGLRVNEEKSQRIPPGYPWEYLGLRCHDGTVDVSTNTIRKLKGKVRRLARRYDRLRRAGRMESEEAAGRLIRKLNRKLFGVTLDDNDLCWAQWFFPVLNTSQTLKGLDGFIQEKLRFAATGRYTKRNYKTMPYEKLRELGYIPLTTAFYAFRGDKAAYFELIRARSASAPDFRKAVPQNGA